MKAVVWQGRRDVGVETVPDPTILEPTDAIIRVTSSGLCGSDLHLYDVMTPFMTPGDIGEAIVCGADVGAVRTAVDAYADAGFTSLHLHQVGPDQRGFLEWWANELAPALAD